jgi:hypothetical protein
VSADALHERSICPQVTTVGVSPVGIDGGVVSAGSVVVVVVVGAIVVVGATAPMVAAPTTLETNDTPFRLKTRRR